MADYILFFNQQWVGDHDEEWFRSRVEPSVAVVEEMKAAGVYIFAGGLEEGPAVGSADPTQTPTLFSDGPFSETKEFLGGFALIDVPDDQAAMMWAGKIAEGCGWPHEVRRVMSEPDLGTTGAGD